jgi:hypothetical protein
MLVFVILAALIVAIGVTLQSSDGGFTRWLQSLHGTPRH